MTYIGFIISVDKSALQTSTCFKIPIIYTLAFSWILFTLCLSLIFIFKWFDNIYLYFVDKYGFLKARINYDKSLIELIEADSNVSVPGGDKEKHVDKLKQQICSFNEMSSKTEKERDWNLNIIQILKNSIPIIFILGIILALHFVLTTAFYIVK